MTILPLNLLHSAVAACCRGGSFHAAAACGPVRARRREHLAQPRRRRRARRGDSDARGRPSAFSSFRSAVREREKGMDGLAPPRWSAVLLSPRRHRAAPSIASRRTESSRTPRPRRIERADEQAVVEASARRCCGLATPTQQRRGARGAQAAGGVG